LRRPDRRDPSTRAVRDRAARARRRADSADYRGCRQAAGTISLVIQAIGKSTHELTTLAVGDAITDIAGPLGTPTHLLASGHAVCVGGGVGTAVAYPIAQALSRNGVKVTSIIGGRSKEWVIYEDELRAVGEVIVCTDDGSYGRPGFVTEALKELCEAGGIDEVFAIARCR